MNFDKKLEYILDKLNINQIEKKLRYCNNFHKDFVVDHVVLNKDERYELLFYLMSNFDYNQVVRDNNSYYAKRQRLKKRVINILESGIDAYFLTLTFDDETLLLDKKTRRKYVQRFLKKYCADYVANIDYGKKNKREHYHAIVCCDSLPDWPYGFKKYSLIHNENIIALSSYIAKISNHALKDETGKRDYLIYARQH